MCSTDACLLQEQILSVSCAFIYLFILSLIFCLLDLWHSDNEQAITVIGTAAFCPSKMHTSRLETVSSL